MAVHSLVDVGRLIHIIVLLLLVRFDGLLPRTIVWLILPVDLLLLLLLRHLMHLFCRLSLLLLLLRLVGHLRQMQHFAAHELHGVSKELVVLHVDLVDHV